VLGPWWDRKSLLPLIDEASGDHGQHVFDPGFWAGIKRPVQFEFFGQLEHGATGAVFPRLKDEKRIGVALGQGLSGESGLDEFELIQVQAGEPAVVGVPDFALLAEGGAENASGVKAVGLDFEMEWADRLHDGYTIRSICHNVNTMYHNVWLPMNSKTEVKPLSCQGLARFREGKMRFAARCAQAEKMAVTTQRARIPNVFIHFRNRPAHRASRRFG